MPYDSNGNFSLVPGTIVADGMNVQPSQHNPPFQDIAQGGLSLVLLRDGRAPMTGVLNMNGNKITGASPGENPGDVVTMFQISDLAVDIGDGTWSLRDLSPNWLRRDGSVYLIADYPELAALLPPLPDGVSWTAKASIPNVAGATPQDLAYGSGLYVAGGGNGYVFVSSDLTAWTSVQVSAVSGAIWSRTAYGAGVFVVSGNGGRIATSIDGLTWTVQTPLVGATWNDIIWTGTEFLLFGTSGGSGVIYMSASGGSGTWTSVSVPAGTAGILSAARNGSNIVAITGTQSIVSTNTGSTWTLNTTGVSGLRRVEVQQGTSNAVAVGTNGTIISSSNGGTSWTPRTSGVTALLSGLARNDAGWIATGTNGTAVISSNMTSWTAAPTGGSENFVGAIVDPTNQTNGYVVMSSGRTVLQGDRTFSNQFRVPAGPEPLYDWVRAR
jgi:hypothetical protein